MPTTKEDLENFIKEYIKENLKIRVLCNGCGDGYMTVNVSLSIDDEEIAVEQDGFYFN